MTDKETIDDLMRKAMGTYPRDEVLVFKVELQAAQIVKLEERIDQIERDEKRKLIWGILALGSVVMTLGGTIWSYRSVIFRGVQ